LTTTQQTRHSVNPATGESNAEVPLSTQVDLDRTVAAAQKAQKTWARTTVEERRKLLHAYAEVVESYREEFVQLLISEQGKAYGLAQDELTRAVTLIKDTTNLELKEEIAQDNDGKVATVRYVPIGVGCALVPWNYPVLLAWGKIAPAVFSGNVIIVKPSPDTPYCGLKSIELAQRFFPPGVIQALSGGHELGPFCTSHPGIDKIAFTESISTGKLVMESCAKTLKRLTLELGGNDAAIVCEDVDFDVTVPPVRFSSVIRYCCASLTDASIDCSTLLHQLGPNMHGHQAYVHASIYDKFLEALVAYSKNFKVGPGTDPTAFVRPLQNSIQLQKVQSFYDEVVRDGLHPVLGSSNDAYKGHKGFFAVPTLIDNLPDSARIVREEPFGPIVPIMKWDGSDDDIIERVNDIDIGLGASVWSKGIARAEKMARKLQAGSVWVNMHFEVNGKVPFGGHKNSGIGSEWGLVGLKNWCNVQTVWVPKVVA
jgi:acyl-CoA reductase-like NAD-dependent aldehyde dehydrogenase